MKFRSSPKLCKDCVHCVVNPFEERADCWYEYPTLGSVWSCSFVRRLHYDPDINKELCGPRAKYFQLRPKLTFRQKITRILNTEIFT